MVFTENTSMQTISLYNLKKHKENGYAAICLDIKYKKVKSQSKKWKYKA